MSARFAVYYAPAIEDPLFQAGACWLGRDPGSNAQRVQPDLPGVAEITSEPARYGFHATLKPPMRLALGKSWGELKDAARHMGRRIRPFLLPPLAVTDLRGFLALRETEPCCELQALADLSVEALDGFREPASAAELTRRRHGGLVPRQEAMLVQWGYPYAFDTWFFHMTLTRRLNPDEMALYRPAAEAHFSGMLARPRRVTDICLFTQPAADAGQQNPFTISVRIPLLG